MENKSKLLGSGTYGCIYKPPIKCRHLSSLDEKHKNNIMKVVETKSLNPLEEEISYVVREIDPVNIFFIPLESDRCVPDEHNNALAECKIYNVYEPYLYTGMFLKDGGMNLEEYIKTNKYTSTNVFYWAKHLLEGLNILHENGILHLDIKTPNIVIDDNLNVRIIDFGISVFADKFDLSDTVGPYPIYPLFYNVLHAKDISYLYKVYESLAVEYVDDYKRGTSTDIIERLYKKSKNKELYFRSEVRKNGMYKIDAYMLMLVMDRMLDNKRNPIINDDEYLYHLILEMITFGKNIIPSEQLDIKQLYDYISKII